MGSSIFLTIWTARKTTSRWAFEHSHQFHEHIWMYEGQGPPLLTCWVQLKPLLSYCPHITSFTLCVTSLCKNKNKRRDLKIRPSLTKVQSSSVHGYAVSTSCQPNIPNDFYLLFTRMRLQSLMCKIHTDVQTATSLLIG